MGIGVPLGLAIGGWIAYRLTARFTRAEAVLDALPVAKRADPELIRLHQQLAPAARYRDLLFYLCLGSLAGVLVVSGLGAGDLVVRGLLLASGVSFVGAVGFGARWRILQLRIDRYAEKLAPAADGAARPGLPPNPRVQRRATPGDGSLGG